MSDDNTLSIAQENALEFFGFGMDRKIPHWIEMNYDLPVLHLGPGQKGNQPQTIDLEWPEYDFESPDCLRFSPIKMGDGPGKFRTFQNESVGGVVATHVLEHLADPRPLIWEVSRVLAPGCPFNIVVPKAGSNLWHQDLDHKTGFVLDTWKTLLDSSYYLKGKNEHHRLAVGFNMEMSIKEGNNVIVTQLIKI